MGNLISDVIRQLELLAPPALQESYDNSGLLTGNPADEVSGILVCLDSTEDIINEAVKKGCNLIVAHHPVIFSGLKRLTGRNYIERTIISAIKNDICIYAIHTNLDNVLNGVNDRISRKIGLEKTHILEPMKGKLRKLVTYVPTGTDAENVRNGLFKSGAGHIGAYDQCSFNVQGTGTFRGGESSNPYVGKKGERHHEQEERIEVVFPEWRLEQVLKGLREAHPYEEIAYDIVSLENSHRETGAGMIGQLPKPMKTNDFLDHLKSVMNTGMIRHTRAVKDEISKVAVCGGSGSFLLNSAIRQQADVFVTADFKYHQFFDADGRIVIADIGHFESEQFTIELLGDYLREKFTKFAVHFTEINTNPIHYR